MSHLSFTLMSILGLLLLLLAGTASSIDVAHPRPSSVRRSLGKRRPDNWPIKTGYVAFGDSYGAGLGTGTTSTDKCRVGSNNFGDLLNRWTDDENVDFQRYVCSGDTTEGLNGKIDEWHDSGKADLATLSIGGNDLFFSDLVWYCVITPNNVRSGSYNRQKCIETEAKARALLDNEGDGGLKDSFKKAYRKIMDKSSRDDFHLYVTSYVDFFEPDDGDCDKTTFHYNWERYNPPSDWPFKRIVYLTTDLRHELNDLVGRLNSVIAKAVEETNDDIGRSRVHFVDVNTRFRDGHRWCEPGDFHEPDANRADTWLFLSGWKDMPLIQSEIPLGNIINLVSEAASIAAEVAEKQAVIDSGKIELPDAATCSGQLGSDPDPWDHWKCRAAESIREDPEGPLTKSLNDANAALAAGDVESKDISSWVPTRQIKTFHPRSPGMLAYRDALIEQITSFQASEQGSCKMEITEIRTCEDPAENLYARLTITSPSGDTLYQTGQGTSAPGPSIDDKNRLHLQKEGMSEELLVVGEHQDDYIQFYYGDQAWKSWDTDGDARCELVGENWPEGRDVPEGCPGPADTRTFNCQYIC